MQCTVGTWGQASRTAGAGRPCAQRWPSRGVTAPSASGVPRQQLQPVLRQHVVTACAVACGAGLLWLWPTSMSTDTKGLQRLSGHESQAWSCPAGRRHLHPCVLQPLAAPGHRSGRKAGAAGFPPPRPGHSPAPPPIPLAPARPPSPPAATPRCAPAGAARSPQGLTGACSRHAESRLVQARPAEGPDHGQEGEPLAPALCPRREQTRGPLRRQARLGVTPASPLHIATSPSPRGMAQVSTPIWGLDATLRW